MSLIFKHDDCLELIRELPDKSINAIITDPPYGYLKHKLDKPFDYQTLFKEFKRVLTDKGFLVIFGRGVMLAKWVVCLDSIGFNFKEEIVWDKSMGTVNPNAINRCHEMINIFGINGGVLNKVYENYIDTRLNEGKYDSLKRYLEAVIQDISKLENIEDFKKWRDTTTFDVKRTVKHKLSGMVQLKKQSTGKQGYNALTKGSILRSVINIPKEQYSYIHPTQKPIALLEKLIELTTQKGDVILDPFGGSGSLAIASYNLNRNSISYEIDQEYFEAATNRIKDTLGLFYELETNEAI